MGCGVRCGRKMKAIHDSFPLSRTAPAKIAGRSRRAVAGIQSGATLPGRRRNASFAGGTGMGAIKRSADQGRSHHPDQGAQEQRKADAPYRGGPALLLVQEPYGSGWSFWWEAETDVRTSFKMSSAADHLAAVIGLKSPGSRMNGREANAGSSPTPFYPNGNRKSRAEDQPRTCPLQAERPQHQAGGSGGVSQSLHGERPSI